MRLRARLVLFGVSLAILFTAFEVLTPVFSAGPVNFTTSELAAGFFIVTALVWAAADRSRFFSWRVLDLAVILFVLSNFLSIAVALDKGSALKFSLRMTFAALVYLGVSRLPSRAKSHLVVAGAITVTLLVVSVIGLLEAFVGIVYWPDILSSFQQGIITFGTFYNVRISSTLPFPTVYSMYLELCVPVALVFGLWLIQRRGLAPGRRRWLTIAVIAVLLGVMTVQVYTYTRSAIVATPLSLAAGASAALLFGYGRRMAAYFGLGAAFLVLVLGTTTFLSNKMATRLGVSEPVQRYGAQYELLEFPSTLYSGRNDHARVRIRNTSDVVWKIEGSGKVSGTYRWLSYPEKEWVEIENYIITDLPHDIVPGEEIELDVEFTVPQAPGRYVLALEMIKTGVGWFSSDEQVVPLIVPLAISESGSRPITIPEGPKDFVYAQPVLLTPERNELWLAAAKAWKANPVLGLGPDQFRLRYNEYEPGLQEDQRVRTHNIYLEALANTGLVGLAVMAVLLASALWYQVKLIRNRNLGAAARLVSLGLFTALVAYLAHGLLDCFLWQTGVAFLFFVQLGLTAWLCKYGEAV